LEEAVDRYEEILDRIRASEDPEEGKGGQVTASLRNKAALRRVYPKFVSLNPSLV
jgi:hypothetical protein